MPIRNLLLRSGAGVLHRRSCSIHPYSTRESADRTGNLLAEGGDDRVFPPNYVVSHPHARHVLRRTKLPPPRRFQHSGTGVPPVRIVSPTHGRDARATT